MTSGHTARASPPVAGRRHNPVIDLPVAVGPPGPAARYVRRRRRWKPGPRAPLGDVPLRILRFPGNERACPSGRQRRMTKTFARPTRQTPHDLGREIRPQQQRPLLRRPTNVSCRNDCRSSDGNLTVAKHNDNWKDCALSRDANRCRRTISSAWTYIDNGKGSS